MDTHTTSFFSFSTEGSIFKLDLRRINETTDTETKESSGGRVNPLIRRAFSGNSLTTPKTYVRGSSCHFYHGNGRP